MRVHFDEPLVSYMTRELETARPDTPVEQLARLMHGRGISGVPIVDDRGQLVGVVSRTDLIQLAVPQAGYRPRDRVMPLPHRKASEIMTHDPVSIPSSASLRRAARMMIDHLIHRVFVTEGGKLAGVIATVDMAAAVRDARLTAPVSSAMTSPILTIDVGRPLSEAVGMLERVHVTGIVVTEDEHPIGVFDQTEAIASRDLPRSTPVEAVYSAAVICLPTQTKLHRAAAQVAQLDVRRIVACKDREAVGIVTGTDFARLIALS